MSEAFSIKDKVCIITGAGKGIGREVAGLFYREGASLALITRNQDDFASFKKELSPDDRRILLRQGDVSDEETVKGFVKEALDKFGRIDVLINNAGIRFRKRFLDISTAEWDNVINTNLRSVYIFCREAGRQMTTQKRGKIINMASIVGTLGLPELAAYGTSKGGMITLTKCLAVEWAEQGVTVNAIAPGFCETSYAENFRKKTDLFNFTIERTPLKKWGTSQDVASACLFLASDAANYITGEVLNVDGGWSAW